ncbi:MAG: 50S ribosomal protein L10 [Cyanobacteria bacterium P01_H01_bin.74]
MGKLAAKQQTVEMLKKEFEEATVMVVADYRGLSVSQLTALRIELYKVQAKFTVAKNTLAKRANPELSEYLTGPTAMLIGCDDQVAPVKILSKFFKERKMASRMRGGLLDGKVLSPAEVDTLVQLPPIEELRGKLVGAINTPASKLVMAITSPQKGLVTVLDKYAKQLQENAS